MEYHTGLDIKIEQEDHSQDIWEICPSALRLKKVQIRDQYWVKITIKIVKKKLLFVSILLKTLWKILVLRGFFFLLSQSLLVEPGSGYIA